MLIDLRIDIPVNDKQILPAIVIVIEEAITEFHKRNRRLGDSGLVTHVRERSSTVVPEQYGVIVGEGRAYHGEMSAIVIVSDGEPHIRRLASVSIQREPALVALVPERALSAVDIQIVGRRVV